MWPCYFPCWQYPPVLLHCSLPTKPRFPGYHSTACRFSPKRNTNDDIGYPLCEMDTLLVPPCANVQSHQNAMPTMTKWWQYRTSGFAGEWDHWHGCRHPPARRSHCDLVLWGCAEDNTERRAGSKLAGAPRTPCANPVYLHGVAALVGYQWQGMEDLRGTLRGLYIHGQYIAPKVVDLMFNV